MRIELKNIQHAAFASQETACFTATVYLDGKRAGTVSNTGTGGGHCYDTRALESALGDHARTLPPRPIDERDPSQGTYQPDADTLIDDLEVQCEPKRHMQLWHDLQTLYSTDLPALPLFFRADPYIIPHWLKGIRPTGHQYTSTLTVENWRVEK